MFEDDFADTSAEKFLLVSERSGVSNREVQNLSRLLGFGSSCDFSSIGIGDGTWTHFTWISCTNFKNEKLSQCD
jgi:hypothetical protein